MSIEITMPRLSDTMERGMIIKWNVQEGDAVSAGDSVADIETDKAIMEMQVFDDGHMARIVVPAGEMVEVGTLIAVLAEDDEAVEDVAGAVSASTPSVSASPPTPTATPTPVAGDGRIKASPVARRLAEEHGIDLSGLQGSGPSGRIVKRDVQRAVETGQETVAAVPPSAATPVTPTPVTTSEAPPVSSGSTTSIETIGGLRPGSVPLSNIRQTIARRLVEAKSTIPHYQVTVTFDMEALLGLRSTLNAQLTDQGIKLSVNDFLIRACALAIHHHPEFNASWGGDHLEIHADVNIGLAIALPPERGGGLVVATIRQADRKSLRTISQDSLHLAEKARTRGLTIEEMADSTFTISNLGMFGVEHFTAIINPPNSAILAVGAALQKPVVRDGELAVGWEMSATLSLDHRIIDGASAARYLASLRQLIENPATLLV
jgi:pyruvate dehydrogenase E2 component (dihydrolipoamide acetyltransferase)